MMKYILTKEAVKDLDEIWLYTYEKWSVEQADRFYQLIMDEIGFIASNPSLGRSLDHIRQGYRSSIVKSHLVFYKILDDDRVLIVRILHQRMDFENRLK
jgi:toxin ParE1/3/4